MEGGVVTKFMTKENWMQVDQSYSSDAETELRTMQIQDEMDKAQKQWVPMASRRNPVPWALCSLLCNCGRTPSAAMS